MTVYEVLLLQVILGSCMAQVTVIQPPENKTACRSSDVTISCRYTSATALPVTWIINETTFDEASLMNSTLYQLNNPTTPPYYSLTVFSINHTTTFQCDICATYNDMRPMNIISARGTVTVIDIPVVEITATGGCGYVSVLWTVPDDNDACPVRSYTIKLLSSAMDELDSAVITKDQHTFNKLPFNTLFYVTVFSHHAYLAFVNSFTTSVRTLDLKDPIPINVTANVKINNDKIMITVSWQLQPPSCTTANIIKYNITVMDQYNQATITVPANMSSVEISDFSDNGTSIVANREFTITVSAINDQGTSYPSDPVVAAKNTETAMSDKSDASYSSAIVITITCVVTLLVTVTVTAIATFTITYMLMRRKYKSTPQDTSDKVLYEQVHSPSSSITKNDPQCQKNPAYDVGGKVIMDTNPAYESYK